MDKKQYIEKTDEAWNTVYAKLERNGLMEKPNHHSVRHTFVRWSVASAAVLLCVVLSVFYINKETRTPQMLTQSNDEINSTLIKTLEDGSVVYLEGKASIKYPVHFLSDKRNVILKGNATFDVAKNKVCPFFIDTKYVKVEVVGTSFNIKSDDKTHFELSVTRGIVKVYDKRSGSEAAVRVGETAVVGLHGLQVRQTCMSTPTGRNDNCIRFKDETLSNILRVINMKSTNIRLQATPELANRRLTVSFYNNSPEMVAVLICEALNVSYVVKGDVITIE